jgi:hypothetical protein
MMLLALSTATTAAAPAATGLGTATTATTEGLATAAAPAPATKVANVSGDVGILEGVAFGFAVISAGIRIREIIHVCMPLTPATATGATAATASTAPRIDILGQVLAGGSQVRLPGAGASAEIGHLAGPAAATGA